MTTEKKLSPVQQKAAERRAAILEALKSQGRPCLANWLLAAVNARTKQGSDGHQVQGDIKRLVKDGEVVTEVVVGPGPHPMSRHSGACRAQKMTLVRLARPEVMRF